MLFIFELIFNFNICEFKLTVRLHYLSYHSGVGLPFFFSWFLMILPEVVIWCENRQPVHCDFGVRRSSCEHTLGKEVEHAVFDVEEGTTVLNQDRLDRAEAKEGTLFEFDDMCTVGSSTFRIQNQRWPYSLLTLFLSM